LGPTRAITTKLIAYVFANCNFALNIRDPPYGPHQLQARPCPLKSEKDGEGKKGDPGIIRGGLKSGEVNFDVRFFSDFKLILIGLYVF
jgi:hypothetical protein